MKRAIVVGSGAGGATVAKELQGKFDVTVLEAGGAFRPLTLGLPAVETMRKAGLLFDERELPLIFPTIQIRKTPEIVLVNGIGLGGTTTICTGNALRMDRDLRAVGIDLDAEFAEVYQEIPITTAHQKRWRKHTRRLFEICRQMDLDPQPTPKMGDYDRCVGCGRCVLGCLHGAKWDSREFLRLALERGARVIPKCRVERVVIENGRVTGVTARKGLRRRFYPADLVVLAAGGFGTPAILQNSGISCEPRLFVDPVLCVAVVYSGAAQHKEIEMPFVVQQPHFILSPYFDYLSFPFNKKWRYPASDILGMMIKLADSPGGTISDKFVGKVLTDEDKQRLGDGVEICREILCRFSGKQEPVFLGTINAGHPGGMLPLTGQEAESFHHRRLPGNLYVADATLLPQSLGNPPILTIVAMAKRVSRMCIQTQA
ncbi:MAG: GMC family oxidoreductase [Anaerolineae bacterium]|nr:GMC family oxidoreductase [Anaerolineae bacterium]